MQEDRQEKQHEQAPEPEKGQLDQFEKALEGQPTGAIAITTILLVTILAFWFGVYLLNWLRSS